jgi:hypothetical protein
MTPEEFDALRAADLMEREPLTVIDWNRPRPAAPPR